MTDAVQPSAGRRTLVMLGLLGYIATGFVYLISGLVVPIGFLILLLAFWLVGLWITATYVARWSWWVLASGPLALSFWWAYVTLGGAFLGWTA